MDQELSPEALSVLDKVRKPLALEYSAGYHKANDISLDRQIDEKRAARIGGR